MDRCYISIRDVKAYRITGGVKIVVTTDIPCHLYMRWSLVPPQAHTTPSLRRGLYMHGDRYFCFVAYHDNEQQEPGDTLTHSFIKVPWEVCECRYFHFWGKVGVQVCMSNSPCFQLHLEEEAPPQIHTYLSCWHNRHLFSRHGTWSTARDGYNPTKTGDYQRPNSQLSTSANLNGQFIIYRSYLNFDTHIFPIGATIQAARLGVYVTAVPYRDTPVHITKGLWDEPVVAADFGLQTNEVLSLGSRTFTPADIGKRVWIDLNDDGIAWINQRPIEINQHESFDWGKNTYWQIYGDRWRSQCFTPQTTHTITKVRLRLRRRGSPGTLYVHIKLADSSGCPTGPTLASGTLDGNTLSTETWGDWHLCDLGTGCTLSAGTTYVIELHKVGGSSSVCVEWIGASGTPYPNGHVCSSNNAGSSWTSYTAYANYFIEYESYQAGGTKFCLRTTPDLSDSPPGSGARYVVHVHSAQKGDDFLPILELTLA